MCKNFNYLDMQVNRRANESSYEPDSGDLLRNSACFQKPRVSDQSVQRLLLSDHPYTQTAAERNFRYNEKFTAWSRDGARSNQSTFESKRAELHHIYSRSPRMTNNSSQMTTASASLHTRGKHSQQRHRTQKNSYQQENDNSDIFKIIN